VNRMVGEERVIVCDLPGTTRDSIYVQMTRLGKTYTLIDTAGVRKKKNVTEVIEKFSVIKTLQSIKDANVVLLVFDARVGLTDQDLQLIHFTIEAGRGLIVCANKWDGMNPEDRETVKTQLGFRLKFAEFAKIFFISALHGTNVGTLFPAIDAAFKSAFTVLNTTNLTELLEKAVSSHPPPIVQGRRIKLRFAHCGGHNPPLIVIHGNQTENMPQSYQKYLSKFFIKALKLEGTPLKIIFKSGDNPFAGKKNVLTARQIYKRARLMKHVKKKAKRS
jgi:GTPase